jgi:hypothetical protein
MLMPDGKMRKRMLDRQCCTREKKHVSEQAADNSSGDQFREALFERCT